MKKELLPASSKRYSQQAFVEKEKWHRRRARMSLEKKLQSLDRLLEMNRYMPKLVTGKIHPPSNR